MSWLAIDFGTSECSAAYIKDGGVRKVKFTSPDSNSQYDFPTVAFVDENGKIEVGYQALSKAAKKPENFIYEFKLDLNNDHDKIEGISSVGYIDVIRSILSEIKKEAETADNYGGTFTNAIITIPVGFQQNSIDKIKKAALNSKFNKIEFVSEPQAAAVYFNHFISENFPDKELNALIYDLGGGTFDPALISIKNSNTGKDFSLPISGEGTLKAGKYFDKLIRQNFVNQFPIPKDNYTVYNQEVQDRCKNRIKRVLSGFETATVNVPFIPSETFTLSKDEFNQMIAESVDETIVKCNELLNSNQQTWNDIDLIFLVGGSCNVPHVRKSIEIHAKTFNPNIQIIWNEYSNKQTEPQYAVSLGAALYINHLKESTMNASTYSKNRDELIKILSTIISFEELDEVSKNGFINTRKRILENQFNIVLIGEFQGGKSTTFNTFCDGREISPRGAKIKTSACKITAQHLSDENINEYARFAWKSPKDILSSMSTILEIDKFKNIDITNQNDNEILMEKLFQEWKKYTDNEKAYDNLDQLWMAILATVFIRSHYIEKEFGKNQSTIDDVASKITFPIDWQRRWSDIKCVSYSNKNQFRDKIKNSFKDEEIIFIFIAEVDCFIKSPNLGSLGCSITDCPGLFASNWDTSVADQAMRDSDAILYLIGGKKEISKEESKNLSSLLSTKTIFAFNTCEDQMTTERLIETDCASICNSGFKITVKDIFKYHALLAFCCEFGSKFISNKLDEFSKKQFRKLATSLSYSENLSIEQLWIKIVNKQLMNIDQNFDPIDNSIRNLSEESITKLQSYSGATSLFEYIKDYVVRNKAESILVTNGTSKVSGVLNNIIAEIKANIDTAKKENSVALKLLDKEDREFINFQNYVKHDIIGNSFKDDVYYRIIRNYEDYVFNINVIKEIANDSSLIIARQSELFPSKEYLQNLAEKTIKTELQRIVSKYHNKWNESFKESELRKQTLQEEIEKINDEIKLKWSELQTDGIINSCPLEFPSGDYWTDSNSLKDINSFGVGDNLKKISNTFRFVDISMIVVAIPLVVIGKLWDYVSDAFGAKGKLYDIFEAEFDKIENELNNNKASKYYDVVYNSLQVSISEKRNELNKEIEGFVKGFGEEYKALYAKNLLDQKNIFEAKIAKAREIASMTTQKKEEAIKKEEESKIKISNLKETIDKFESIVIKQLRNGK